MGIYAKISSFKIQQIKVCKDRVAIVVFFEKKTSKLRMDF
jgi:hypothetical protein